MKITIENNLLYLDNKRLCFAKVNEDGRQDVRSEPRTIATQYSHAHGRVLPLVSDLGWIGDSSGCAISIGSVLGNDGPLKCCMSLGGLVARIEAAEDFGAAVTVEIK